MALRTIILRNMDTGAQLTMPVVPESFDVEDGRAAELLDMAGYGQVSTPGLTSLFQREQSFLLPSSSRSYAQAWQPPYTIVNTLIKWSQDGNVVRYIVYGTTVNAPCLIQSVRYAEQDGTNDVLLTLTLRKYRYLTAAPVQSLGGNNQRDDTEHVDALTTRATGQDKVYQIVDGDCLISIATAYYGDASMAYRLATYNGIKNPNLIYTGDTLRLPDVDTLKALEPTYGAALDFSERISGAVNAAAGRWVQEVR